MKAQKPQCSQFSISRFRTLIMLVAVALAICTSIAQGEKTYIYVESNRGQVPSRNAVLAFSNDGLGNLTALAGSPYLTNGTGVFDQGPPPLTEFDADQEVIADANGDLLYAVNGASNTIAAFTINSDGTLTTVLGSPFPSGGQDPVSLGLTNSEPRQLVMANKNEDPNQDIGGDLPNYTTFTVSTDGSLTMNVNSTLDVGAGSSPSQALMGHTKNHFFGMEFKTSRLTSYRVSKGGAITELSSLGPPTTGEVFLGEILHPSRRFIYVGLPLTSQVGVYRYGLGGELSFVTSVPNNGVAICWLAANAAGTRLYTSETETGTISVYDIADPASPLFLQQITLSGTDETVSNIALDPTEGFLYALVAHTIHIVNLDADGMMSETITPVAFGGASSEKPLGLAVVRK